MIYGPTPTEEIKKTCRNAYTARDKAAFGDAASHLLIRGYKPMLGPRGGISFTWCGATQQGDEHWQATREQFASVSWK